MVTRKETSSKEKPFSKIKLMPTLKFKVKMNPSTPTPLNTSDSSTIIESSKK